MGRLIVKEAVSMEDISEITLIIRNKLKEWDYEEKHNYKFSKKVSYIFKDDFEKLDKCEEYLVGYDAFICTLGYEYVYGHAYNNMLYMMVEHDYPMEYARMAKKLNVKYFGLLSC